MTEFYEPYSVLWGALGFIFWCISFFHLRRKGQLIVPNVKGKFSGKILRTLLFLVGAAGWAFISMALMREREPIGFANNKIEVNDVFIVVDVSRSMLAEDFKPNRMEVTKEKIREFVKLRPTDRIGIIMFSERAFTLLPLSTDLKLIERVINDIQIGFLGSGTNIGDALALAVGRLTQSLADNKVILLLTDGVSNVGVINPMQAAQMAKDKNIKVYTVAVGGSDDAQIPVGAPVFGKQRYQMIPGGSVDEGGLAEIAQLTGAKAYSAKSEEALRSVLDEVNNLERTQIDVSKRALYKELYYERLIWGIVLLLIAETMRFHFMREVV